MEARQHTWSSILRWPSSPDISSCSPSATSSTSIRRLNIETSLLSTRGFRALIEKCPLLEVLHLDVSIFMLPGSIWGMLATQCPRLRILSVHHANTACYLPDPKALHQMFPNMEEVRVQPISIAAVLDKLGSCLERLELEDVPQGSDSDDRDIANTVSLSAQWTDLWNLGSLREVGRWTMAAVLSNCHQLKMIDLGRGVKIRSAHVEGILSRARCLKSIRIDSGTLIVMASDLVASEWATTSLRVLSMGIDLGQGYSEQSNHASLAEVNTTTPFASCPLQRQLLRRIGTQTMLQELILGSSRRGQEESEINHEGKYLDVALASGLDELAGLKELAVLDLGDLGHTVDMEELERICRQWPSLWRLRGVIRTWMPQPGAQERIQIRERRGLAMRCF
ncbi:hypothetical protein BG006_004478 [Podila minutissima]|uniref:Uncharacterized protein n=1 Tax=Podila minutissima TaxID=64525 RepID=A0A9P5SQ83_9FUNG|nr:hypothetical protein BG006_004478 [Podila minutissima]